MKANYIPSILTLLHILLFPIFAQSTILVDFGDSQSNNTYGLENWNQLLIAPEMTYTSTGPGGLAFGSDFEEFSDFMGVRGTLRQFSTGERIVVTWYNNSDETISFTSRISFTDDNNPSENSPDGNWYTMRSFEDYRLTFTQAPPHALAKTVFNIADTGVHKTNEIYSLVNINLAIEWGEASYKQYLICDKIELWNDGDLYAPLTPVELTATPISDSKIELTWNIATDDLDAVEFLIYLNGEVEGYSREHTYTAVFLEPNTEYTFTVTALDIMGNETEHSASVTAATLNFSGGNNLLNPEGFEYLGAFRLPEDFAWGGEAIAYNQNGDLTSSDNYPGSIFATNLNQPENGLVGEVTIPEPIISASKNFEELNRAVILQNPTDIRPANVNNWDYVDIWRTGLEYVPGEGRLYSSWSIHYTVGGEKNVSISACDALNLAGSTKYGAWYLGDPASNPIAAMANDYLFSIPPLLVNTNLSDKTLVCGRFRDGGLSGLGPTMYAFSEVGVTPPGANSSLDISAMLEYGSVEGTDNYNYPNSIDGYKHSDEWRDAAFMQINNQSAVAIIGRKALGDNWYGYQGEMMRHDWVYADQPYPSFDLTDPDGKGWKSHNYIPMIILYKFDDLMSVANGIMNSYEPQPYSALRLDKSIFWNNDCEIRSMAYDPVRSRLFVTEFDRERDGNLIIHVWQLNEIPVDIESTENIPIDYKLEQNYPNPFNPKSKIKYQIAQSARVELVVYDLLGREITKLVNEYKSAGAYEVEFDGSRFSSGIYFYTLKSCTYVETRKMIMLK